MGITPPMLRLCTSKINTRSFDLSVMLPGRARMGGLSAGYASLFRFLPHLSLHGTIQASTHQNPHDSQHARLSSALAQQILGHTNARRRSHETSTVKTLRRNPMPPQKHATIPTGLPLRSAKWHDHDDPEQSQKGLDILSYDVLHRPSRAPAATGIRLRRT